MYAFSFWTNYKWLNKVMLLWVIENIAFELQYCYSKCMLCWSVISLPETELTKWGNGKTKNGAVASMQITWYNFFYYSLCCKLACLPYFAFEKGERTDLNWLFKKKYMFNYCLFFISSIYIYIYVYAYEKRQE